MALPKRRQSNSRTGKRRAHDHLAPVTISVCSNCGTAVMPHRICPNCGFYKGRQVLVISKTDEKNTKEK